jgi:hypothetical protein
MTGRLEVVLVAALAAVAIGAQAPSGGPPAGVDVVSADMGGRVEWATSHAQYDAAADNLIAKTINYGWMSGASTFPQDIVFSFFLRQSALVARVEVNPVSQAGLGAAKDVEVWVSTASATEGFTKVAEASLKNEDVLQPIAFTAVEAVYLKLRVLSSYAPASSGQRTLLSRVRVIEGEGSGYTPMLVRHPVLAALARGEIPTPAADAAGEPPPAGGRDTCRPPPKPGKARFPQSRHVLLLEGYQGIHSAYVREGNARSVDTAAVAGVTLRMLLADAAAPALLVGDPRFDTIVLAQICDPVKRLSKEFRQALMAWVADGHKLIIQDSDICGRSPDYSFLPYPFKTVNPGSAGARGLAGVLEDSTLVSGNPDDDSYLDMKKWQAGQNDLGDSNVVIQWDARWCGAMWSKNKLQKSGFALAYAHFGRGLIIYDGFDFDQNQTSIYRKLVAQELLQPFDPDGLTCSNPLGGFTISTENRLKKQHMTPGQTYTYPLEVLGNFGYSGKVVLEASVVPADPGVSVAFTNAVADLSAADEATSAVTVTASASASIKSKVIAIKGRDANGTSNVLCLDLSERTTGGLSILSGLTKDKAPTKNLEIILDASGSMKALLGKKTRWATALEVLKDVVSKLPSDFSVGLRVYGHTLASTNPKTCTDTALVVPVAPLNPTTLLAAAGKLAPRGETPLVYSILQTPGDLKDVKGGTVVLITDGEESCKGDFEAAQKTLQESGLNLTLNIVGFTLKSAPAQAQLSTLAGSTGGRYFTAQSGAALSRALLLAAVDRLPYRVLNSAGAEVATGIAGASKRHELPPGDYTLVVTAGEETLKAPIAVALRKDETVTVVVKDDRLAIE